MQKVFLADPALKDNRGHHHSLTEIMSRACRAHGARPIWLVSKQFQRSDADAEQEIIGCFSVDTYDAHRAAARPAPAQTTIAAQAPGPAMPNPSLLRCLYRRIPYRYRYTLTPWLVEKVAAMRSMGSRLRGAPPPLSGVAAAETIRTRTPAQELLDILQRFDCKPDDVVLFHTADAQTYRDIVELYVDTARPRDWDQLPIVRLSTPYDENVMPHNRRPPTMQTSVTRLRSLGLIGSRVFLHAENDLLAAHLAALLDLPVSALHIPPFDLELQCRSDDPARPLEIMYLGPARTEKGFVKLPPFVRETLERTSAPSLRFTIQVTPQILGYTADVAAAVEGLRAIDDPRLMLIVDPLSLADYRTLLGRADVLLMPYDAERYRHRSSGIAVEAVLAEATIVATRDTFPAHLAGPAGVVIDDSGISAAAIERILDARPDFEARARARKSWYLTEHSQARFAESALAAGASCAGESVRADATTTRPDWKPLVKGTGAAASTPAARLLSD